MKNNQWIDKEEYPFKSNFLSLSMGEMHYVDEGTGAAIVMLHGNPTWSFLYRHLIKGLSKRYRCIAVDYIGFGLSDKPYEWSYLPEDHAENLRLLIEKLDLKDITLVVQDWGGPIGLSYAVNNPDNVRRVVLMNTWMWSLKGDKYYERFSAFMGGPVGRLLIEKYNFFARTLMKRMMNKTKLSKSVHEHYIKALGSPKDRKGCRVFPSRIIGSSEWLDSLWLQRDKIKDIQALILWGMKDIAFREQELQKWMGLFSNCRVIKFDNAGHFLQEEKGSEIFIRVAGFLENNK